MNEIWAGFNPVTEKMVQYPDGTTKRIPTPAAVQVLRMMEPTEAEMEADQVFASRIARARQLAAMGEIVDTQIDVWGWGAANTYKLRRTYGKMSVPDVAGMVMILTPPE